MPVATAIYNVYRNVGGNVYIPDPIGVSLYPLTLAYSVTQLCTERSVVDPWEMYLPFYHIFLHYRILHTRPAILILIINWKARSLARGPSARVQRTFKGYYPVVEV